MDIRAYLQLSNQGTQQPPTVDSNLLQVLRATLSPGEVLSVVTAMNDKGELGILFNGRFIQAELPKTLQAGQQITVQVQEIKDALVLKLLSVDTSPGEAATIKALKDIIETAFPDVSLEDLKRAATTEETQTPGRTSAPAPNLNPESTKILQKLAERGLALTPQNMASPESIEKALKAIINGPKPDLVKELLNQTQLTQKQNIPPAHLELLKTIDSHIANLLASKNELTFAPAKESTQLQLPERLRLYLAISELAVLNGNTGTLDEIAKHLSVLKKDSNPVVVLFKALTTLNLLETDTKHPETKQILRFFNELIEELKTAKEQKLPDKDLRKILADRHGALKQLLSKILEKSGDTETHGNNIALMKAIETLHTAQESLVQLNPLMHELGEPSFFYLPLIFGDLLNKGEITVENFWTRQVSEDGKKGKRSAKEGFVHFAFSVDMPKLGGVKADVAYRNKEIFLTLHFQKKAVAAFVEKKLPDLDKCLTGLGFTTRNLKSAVADDTNTAPIWFQALTERAVVA